MNETETEQLYQIIFRGDRSEGWPSWKRNFVAATGGNQGVPYALGEISKKHHNWKTGESKREGYTLIHCPIHPRASVSGYVPQHIMIVEFVLGHFLPDDAVVHHVDENRSNNRPGNLVACENNSFHLTLHRRARALKACGHADWRLCPYCKTWDDPQNMRQLESKGGKTIHWFHGVCRSNYGKDHHAKRKAAEPEYWKKYLHA